MTAPPIRWKRVYPGKYRSRHWRYEVHSTQTHRPLWYAYYYPGPGPTELASTVPGGKTEVRLCATARDAKEACQAHAIINKVLQP